MFGFVNLLRNSLPSLAGNRPVGLNRWRILSQNLICAVQLLIFFAVFSNGANAATIWEDYQGNNRVTGTSGQDLAGPNYSNNVGATSMPNLRTISSNAANASRTGTGTNIDYTTASLTLCNTDAGYDAAGTGAACQADAMGRVIYARIRMPQTGNYTLYLAHDDEVDLDLSSSYTSTAYRTVSYDIPVSSLASYTANDTTYETVGTTLSSPAANGCALLRIYWNNSGGINHLRLRWRRPDGVTQTVPATALFDPSVATAGCTGAVTTTATSLTLNKLVSSRAASADQFQVTINNGATVVSSAATSGTGTGQQASTGANIITVGTTYTLTDAMAAGSTNPLSSYLPTIACTRNGVAIVPGGSSPSWTVSATAANQAIVCNITNTARPKLTLVKTVTNDNGGTAPATAWTLQAAGTTPISGASGTGAVTNASVTAGTYTLSETGGPSGYAASVWSCSGGSLSGNNLTLINGDIATCTINNNDIAPTITLTKISNGGVGSFQFNGDNGFGTTQTIMTATTGVGVNGTSRTLSSAAVQTIITETIPANYFLSAINCVGLGAGGTATPNLTAGTITLDMAAVAVGGNITCTFTNTLMAPAMSLDKSWAFANAGDDVDGDGEVDAGDIVTYYYDVENTGNVTLNNITVGDIHNGVGTLNAITPSNIASLAPTATAQFSATYTVLQGDVDRQ